MNNKIKLFNKIISTCKGSINSGMMYVIILILMTSIIGFVLVGGEIPKLDNNRIGNPVAIFTPAPEEARKQLQLYTFLGATYTPTPSPTPTPPTPSTPTSSPPQNPGGQSPQKPSSPDIPVPICTQYVAKNGSDSNPGTEASPWLTIQHAANTAVGGNTVCVKAGTYNEKVKFTKSGSSGSKITFSAYPGDTVNIDANGAPGVGAWEGLVNITGSYITFQNFRVLNSNWAGIYVKSANTVWVQGNYIENSKSSGILVTGAGPGNAESTNIKILKNELYHTGGKASPSYESQESLSVGYGITGFEVAYNYLHQVGNGGSNGREGIDAKNGAKNGIIHHNHLVDIPSVAIYIDAFGFYADNIDVYNNLVESGSSGISVSSESGGTSDGVRIYNNIIKGTSIAGTLLPAYDGSSGGTIKNISIINNTYYANNGGSGGIWIGAWAPTYIQNLIIRNNILSQNANTQIKQTDTGRLSGITVEYNLFNGPGGTFGNNAITGDPLFVSAGSDFHLKAASPAIDKGLATGAPSTDYADISRPKGQGFDIGAYEF